jgi:hypothetical protein
MSDRERELTEAVDLAFPDGRLRPEAVGWARKPLLRFNLGPGVSRVARWNYWCVTSRTGALTILVADVGYIGGVLLSFLDFAAKRPVERVYVRPRGLPTPLPDTPDGDVVVDARRIRLAMQARGDEMHVTAAARTVFGRTIDVDLTIARPPAHETVNVLVRWDDERYQYTSKQQALPARGIVRVDGQAYDFGPDNQGFACLDFGRGRWPRQIHWNWGFASGTQHGRTIGMNLGGVWTDGTGVTENGIVIDGRLHKIWDAVDFTYDRRDFKKPWRIRTRSDARVDLVFHPITERSVRIPLGLAHVELHQMMGNFSGTFVDDDQTRITIDDMLGLAEEVKARF